MKNKNLMKKKNPLQNFWSHLKYSKENLNCIIHLKSYACVQLPKPHTWLITKGLEGLRRLVAPNGQWKWLRDFTQHCPFTSLSLLQLPNVIIKSPCGKRKKLTILAKLSITHSPAIHFFAIYTKRFLTWRLEISVCNKQHFYTRWVLPAPLNHQ